MVKIKKVKVIDPQTESLHYEEEMDLEFDPQHYQATVRQVMNPFEEQYPGFLFALEMEDTSTPYPEIPDDINSFKQFQA